jgi:hypothetical protein
LISTKTVLAQVRADSSASGSKVVAVLGDSIALSTNEVTTATKERSSTEQTLKKRGKAGVKVTERRQKLQGRVSSMVACHHGIECSLRGSHGLGRAEKIEQGSKLTMVYKGMQALLAEWHDG